MPSQQSSLSGMRTTLTCHAAIAATDAAFEGPSKIPHPWTHAYSVPERFTPWRKTTSPFPSTRWVPSTRRPLSAATDEPGAEAAVASDDTPHGPSTSTTPTTTASRPAASWPLVTCRPSKFLLLARARRDDGPVASTATHACRKVHATMHAIGACSDGGRCDVTRCVVVPRARGAE